MTDEIVRGAVDGGAEVEIINVCQMKGCHSCKDGIGLLLETEPYAFFIDDDPADA